MVFGRISKKLVLAWCVDSFKALFVLSVYFVVIMPTCGVYVK